MDAIPEKERENTHHLTNQGNFTDLFSAVYRLANTSGDSFKFCQLLGKRGQARFMQHDLLHKGMEQGEVLVPPAELRELRIGEDTRWNK